MSATSENDALLLIKRGETEEFGFLYDLYFERIYTFIFFKTLHKETTEDLTSKTFTKAFEKIESFNQNKGVFSAWLFTIAKRTVIDHYRTRKQTYDISDCWDLSSEENVFNDISNKDQLEKIKTSLKKLKPEHRDLVIMRIWQGMSHKEIAKATGKSEAGCKMMFSRVMRDLRPEIIALLLLFAYNLSKKL